MNKLKKKSGFTLVEMLIVVAIIAVLAAIAIPTYNAQLEKARESVDDANVRTAESIAVADYLLEGRTGEVVYHFNEDDQHNISIAMDGTNLAADGKIEPKAKKNAEDLTVTVTDGGDITDAGWASPTPAGT